MKEIYKCLREKSLLKIEGESKKLEQKNKSRTQIKKKSREALNVPDIEQAHPEAETVENGQYDVSFTIKLLLNEDHKVRRMEVVNNRDLEDTKTWSDWEKELLIDFIVQRAGIALEATSISVDKEIKEFETNEVVKQDPEPEEVPTPKLATRLIISTVKVLRSDLPGGTSLILNPEEEFTVEVQFELEGPEALSFTIQESGFQVKVYARDVTNGRVKLLTTSEDNLNQNILSYKFEIPITGLNPGLYRLFILVILQTPIKMIGHYEGPTFQVWETSSLVNQTILGEAIST